MANLILHSVVTFHRKGKLTCSQSDLGATKAPALCLEANDRDSIDSLCHELDLIVQLALLDLEAWPRHMPVTLFLGLLLYLVVAIRYPKIFFFFSVCVWRKEVKFQRKMLIV